MLRPYLTMAYSSPCRDGVARELLELPPTVRIAEHHLMSGARPDRAELPTHQAGPEDADAHDLETRPFLECFRVPRTLDRDLGCRALDPAEIVGRQPERCRGNVLLEPRELRGAGNWGDPGP